MNSELLKVESLCVNLQGKEVLRNISMEIREGEQWIIFGEAGAGKTVLAHTLAGNHAFRGQIDFSGFEEKTSGNGVVVVDQQHRFRDLQNQSNFYYQQRYNALDAEATMTVSEAISVFDETRHAQFSKKELLETFLLDSLLQEPLIQLSNGENKRLQILKALLSFPYWLILDEPFTGLDADGRRLLEGILADLSASGQHLLLLSNRFHIPDCINRYARLQNGELRVLKNKSDLLKADPAVSQKTDKDFPSAIHFSYPDYQNAVYIRNVHIEYEGKKILEGINWKIVKGACWALTGHNGAGKSTLLSLITADNPQAYANDIYLFDRKRGSGESIWEIKQKIGYLSPELQLYFDPASTGFTALASGLFDTIGLFRLLSADQERYVSDWLQFLECSGYAHRLLTSLPAGIQRMILLGRAMIKKPPLLVLDEPCQGLDPVQTAFTLRTIDRYCALFGASLIFVSHYQEDFPACIRQNLHLEKGKIV
jgi:molybdate transport system ATP-binding protein